MLKIAGWIVSMILRAMFLQRVVRYAIVRRRGASKSPVHRLHNNLSL